MQRLGDPPRGGIRYTRRPGVYGLIRQDQDVLMTVSTAIEGATEVQLPGGGVDPGEHPVTALHREVFEETGWRIAPERRLGAYTRYCYLPDYGFWAQKVCVIYLCRPVRRLGPPTEPHHTPVWTRLDDTLKVLGDHTDAVFIEPFLAAL